MLFYYILNTPCQHTLSKFTFNTPSQPISSSFLLTLSRSAHPHPPSLNPPTHPRSPPASSSNPSLGYDNNKGVNEESHHPLGGGTGGGGGSGRRFTPSTSLGFDPPSHSHSGVSGGGGSLSLSGGSGTGASLTLPHMKRSASGGFKISIRSSLAIGQNSQNSQNSNGQNVEASTSSSSSSGGWTTTSTHPNAGTAEGGGDYSSSLTTSTGKYICL